MASIHHPIFNPTSIRIHFYLEDHVSQVLEATPLRVTYKAFDQDAAIVATANLIAHGHPAHCFPVAHLNRVSWHVNAQL